MMCNFIHIRIYVDLAFLIISERVFMPLAVVVSIIVYFTYAAIIYLEM